VDESDGGYEFRKYSSGVVWDEQTIEDGDDHAQSKQAREGL
jgi:hypothetical protein